MRDIYSDLHNRVTELRSTLTQAILNDQQEITMSLSMASTMGLVGAAGTALATAAQAALQVASAKGNAALGQVEAITVWAGQSKESSSRMRDRGHSWADLNDNVLELRDLMKKVQSRGINNGWSGEAKRHWQTFTDRQIEEHDRFEEAVVKVAPLMFDASDATDQLLMAFMMAAQGALLPGKTIALRPPTPNPAGFGIGTRTPVFAGILSACAAQFSANLNGPWRVQAAQISVRLLEAGSAMRASSAQGAL
ncbi:hypothetical protein [uncultured Tessaracoccus sp.]|uniref:hypothetical protein n=1 Tax=uncultured Tessaracoccus sp. TaxID=905023 RepID=UPI00260C6331|nr:hypothetical protein [uncultured Tessaracoccus sp.]